MANERHHLYILLFLLLFCAALLLLPPRHGVRKAYYISKSANGGLYVKEGNPRRYLIGSVAPTCTYECRGCKYKCRAEQVPVEGNDPINSAYHYKCVCHR
ncbi:Stomagen [Dorcoceras hygrometricum]|uniref:Stomagen n=1 Tax=Dorcoceras hygrometricum TaxID=472368 RepID=A0A2Z7B2L5_9LAMI|nr:Stomagen [Dorcoceras hygrometricum]